jgi:hypothetical protein
MVQIAESASFSSRLGPACRTRKVAILGFAATVADCPWRDPSWELWGMNGFWRAAQPDFGIEAPEDRFSLWFDMHSREYTREYGVRAGFGDEQEKWLQREHPFQIFMLDAAADFPSVRAFPIGYVIATLGRDYFTSTVAYAIAYAATLPDVAEIGLWGIDLVHNTEYTDQRPCAEYWIAKAEAAGIDVTIHERSALLRQRYRYGYEEPPELIRDMRAALSEQIEGLSKAIEKHQADMARLTAQAHTDDGALQAVRGLLGRLDIWERGGRA